MVQVELCAGQCISLALVAVVFKDPHRICRRWSLTAGVNGNISILNRILTKKCCCICILHLTGSNRLCFIGNGDLLSVFYNDGTGCSGKVIRNKCCLRCYLYSIRLYIQICIRICNGEVLTIIQLHTGFIHNNGEFNCNFLSGNILQIIFFLRNLRVLIRCVNGWCVLALVASRIAQGNLSTRSGRCLLKFLQSIFILDDQLITDTHLRRVVIFQFYTQIRATFYGSGHYSSNSWIPTVYVEVVFRINVYRINTAFVELQIVCIKNVCNIKFPVWNSFDQNMEFIHRIFNTINFFRLAFYEFLLNICQHRISICRAFIQFRLTLVKLNLIGMCRSRMRKPLLIYTCSKCNDQTSFRTGPLNSACKSNFKLLTIFWILQRI